MTDFLAALGLMLVFEGVIYGGFPGAARRLAAQMTQLPDNTLRMVGIIAMVAGVALVWLVRR